MLKKGNDGIFFDNTIYLSEESHRRFPIYMRLLQALIILIGSWSFMSIFIRCFELNVVSSYLITAILISGAIFYLLMLSSSYDFLKLIFALVIYGGLLYAKFKQLRNGFFLLENAVLRKAGDYYGFGTISFIADYTTQEKDISWLLIMIIIPVVGILALCLMRGRGKLFCYIIMLIPVVVSFAMGIIPYEPGLVANILVILFLSISNGFYDTTDKVNRGMTYRIGIRSASIFCIIALILLFLIKQFVSIEKYDSIDEIKEAKSNIQSFMMEFSINDITDKLSDMKLNIRSGSNDSSGGLSLGELGRVDRITYDESEHLKIIAPIQSVMEGIYLKGYIGSVYTGDRWMTHPKEVRNNYDKMTESFDQEYFEPAIGSSIILQSISRNLLDIGRIEIRYEKANKNYVYTPYFTIYEENDDVEFNYDLGIASNNRLGIGSYDYVYNISGFIDDFDFMPFGYILSRQLNTNEKKYREFVYETYTKLPDKGLERLKNDFSRTQVGEPSENLPDAIAYIKDYLNRNASYSLSPGRLPKDKDFAEYFLYETQVGFCSHFATAGALMLRAMGYPSRYVEGYAVNSSDLINQLKTSYLTGEISITELSVKDYNAHAWVEVYYDGFGWIPVEFTTGSGMDDIFNTLGDIERFNHETTDEENIEPTEAPPSPTMLPEVELKPSPPVTNSNENIKANGHIDKEEEFGKTSRWLLILPLILIPLAGLLIYYILKSRRKRYLAEECYSKRALRIYRYIEKLFIFSRLLPKRFKSLEEGEEYAKEHLNLVPVEDFERCMDTVRKARFARETISPIEYLAVLRFYKTLRKRIYEGLPRIKKVYFKFIQSI